MATAPVVLHIDATVGEGFDRLAALATPETRAAYVDSLIVSAVTKATCYYAAGRPGRGRYELARLGTRLTRLLDEGTGVAS